MADEKTAEQLAGEVKASFQQSLDKVKEIAETALGEAKKSGEISTAIKEQADEALIKMNGLNEQLSQLEQRVAEGAGGGADRVAEPARQAATHHPDGGRPLARESPLRVPIPHALLEGAGDLRRSRAAADRPRARPSERVPLRRGHAAALHRAGCASQPALTLGAACRHRSRGQRTPTRRL